MIVAKLLHYFERWLPLVYGGGKQNLLHVPILVRIKRPQGWCSTLVFLLLADPPFFEMGASEYQGERCLSKGHRLSGHAVR